MIDQPQDMAGAQDTIYLCNFRVSVDGEWLCLKELQDVEFTENNIQPPPISPPSPEEPWALFAARDPVLIERSNLVNISKLVVKELIETSQKFGRMLDSDHMPLQHFFIVLEHVLRHGLKPKKGLLGPKKELWDILQIVEKYSTEAQDITTSVRDLPTVSTHMGRARAWLRLALMQKKLADYLKVLIDHKDTLLCDYFEPEALMMSDEAFIIIGLLVGLNVIDCNLCVKEENLDCQQGVIDFSLYLRSSHHIISSEDVLDPDNMTTVLDQKNYIEELNRHLNATVANLQAKVESLQTTNALMKEDLDIAKNNISSVTLENNKLKKTLLVNHGKNILDEGGGDKSETSSTSSKKGADSDYKKMMEQAVEIESLKQQVEGEKKRCQELEKELKVQISMKSEKEVAMKLLEKDIHEKQDTIVTLRRQLDDIKQINLEMYKKLQESESTLKQKTELVVKLEAKTVSISNTLDTMEQKLSKCEQEKRLCEETNRKMGQQVAERESKIAAVEGDLRIEREWRQSLQDAVVKDKERVAEVNQEIEELKVQNNKHLELQEEYKALKDLCEQHEVTLEELGRQLSVSKLRVVDLQEEARVKTDSQWTSDKEATHCRTCSREFGIARRKHHCRHCGGIFCNSCSDNTMSLPSSAKPVRVCDDCHLFLIARNSVS